MKIASYMARGNGAYLIHKQLARRIPGYRLSGFNPYLTIFPPLLYLLRRTKNDLVHVSPDYAPFFHVSKVPMVVTFHGYSLDTELARYNSMLQSIHYNTDLRWFTEIALRQAKTVTCVSGFLADLVKRDMGYQEEIKVIHNGVDEKRFVPRSGDRGKYFDVLFCGNLLRKKGADLLPDIISHLDERIRIHYTSGLRTTDRGFDHPRLISLGRIPYDSMHELYPRFDALLFPSVREGFGMAAAEAMACGLPVVASNVGALPELVQHGLGGLLCNVADAAGFAGAIQELADSQSLCKKMGEYNRARIEERFTLDRMVSEYSCLFQELIVTR